MGATLGLQNRCAGAGRVEHDLVAGWPGPVTGRTRAQRWWATLTSVVSAEDPARLSEAVTASV